MLQEALEIFEKKLRKNSRIIIDSHTLKDGTYRLIEIGDDDNWKVTKNLNVYFDKKSKETVGHNDEDYLFIQELDYYSKLLEMNKPIDPKKIIHTNNYLSIAVKKESIVLNKLTPEIIKNFFSILKNPIVKYEKKAKSRELYRNVEEQLGPADVDLINKIENYVLNHDIFKDEDIDLTKKNYVKIFFVFTDREKTIEYYKKESERYLLPNLYNSNDYNFDDEGIILGLPNNNMGMNSKKPFLENKTRKVKVPYLLDQQKALLQSQLFDYLLGEVSKGKYNIYINNFQNKEDIKAYTDLEEPEDLMSGYYLRCRKEKNEVEIIHADNISHYSKLLKKPFMLKNYIGISQKDIDKSTLPYGNSIDNLWQIRHLIDSVFFEGRLQFNLYSRMEDIQINDAVLKRCLLENRGVLSAWFYQGEKNQIRASLDKFTMELIKNAILKDETFKAQRQFNLRWSLLSYFNDERKIGEKMEDVQEKLRKHINSKKGEKWEFDDDYEFGYAIGQLAQYFLSLNKSNNKSSAYINAFLNAKDISLMKKKIMNSYKKYNYLINPIEGGRVQQLVEHIMLYTPQVLHAEYILAGFSAMMLVYEKNKEEKENG
ncbi:hypothetical protein [Candidatus Stoquefichus massiliensis]|uniref:hypothetical protein n=1 Tax=Candidatus Stoquefichus massiliensis TaxID=1470350 RepID=UPI0004814FAA|nr:hypothetical protein [Candidatus Stoquefichus massiliensis]